jgi:hypothetical protein
MRRPATCSCDVEVQTELTEFEKGVCFRCSNLELRIASTRSIGHRCAGQGQGQQGAGQPEGCQPTFYVSHHFFLAARVRCLSMEDIALSTCVPR